MPRPAETRMIMKSGWDRAALIRPFLVERTALIFLSVSLCHVMTTMGAEAAAIRPIKDKWALVVGVSKFKPGIGNLHFTGKDAQEFGDFLVKEENFAPDHVKVLVDRDATRLNIMKLIGESWLPKVVDEDDMVVIYIGSHGSSAKSDILGVNYIVTSDTTPGALLSTAIPTQDLVRIIRTRVPAQRIVIFLDTCFSGAAEPDERTGFVQRSIDVDEIFNGTGKQLVVCSSKPDQVSYEASGLNSGVFSYYLLEGLRLKDRAITVSDAFPFVKEKVEAEVSRLGLKQTPVLKSASGDDIGLSVKPAAPHGELPASVLAGRPPATSVEAVLAAHGKWEKVEDEGGQAFARGDYKSAERQFREAVELADRNFGDMDTRLAASLDKLSQLLQRTRRAEEAEKLTDRAFAIYSRSVGSDSPIIATMYHNL